MMNGSGVILTSEVYSNQLIRTVGDLFKNKILTDVTLVCDDRVKIEAHKVVLSAGSDLFRNFFTNNIHPHPLMFMKGIKHYQLQPLIQFLYHGEVTISQNIIDEILAAAKYLEISELNDTSIENEAKGGFGEPWQNKKQFSKPQNKVYDNIVQNKKEEKIQEPKHTPNLPIKNKVQNECEKCHFKSASEKGLRNHMAFVHRETEPLSIFRCKECPFMSRSAQAFQSHKFIVHNQGENYSKSEKESGSNDIEKTDENAKFESFATKEKIDLKCQKCEFVGETEVAITKHKMLVHDVPKFDENDKFESFATNEKIDLKCQQCEFVGETEVAITKHKTLVHDVPNLEDEIAQLEELVEDKDYEIKTQPKSPDSYDAIPCKRPTWDGKILYDPSSTGKGARKKRSYVSKVWMYGGLEENEDSTINKEYIRCGECGWKTKYFAGSTSNFLRHLMSIHMIDIE